MRQNNEKFNKAMHKLVGVLDKYEEGGGATYVPSLIFNYFHFPF